MKLSNRSPRQYDWEKAIDAAKKFGFLRRTLFFVATLFIFSLDLFLFRGKSYMLLSMLMLLSFILLSFLRYEHRKPRAREMVLLSSMIALTVALNEICTHTIPLHAGTSMVILSGISLGPGGGLMVGMLSRFLCNFYDGQGSWTPWQMAAWGLMGALAGLCFNKPLHKSNWKNTTLAQRLALHKEHQFRMVLGPVLMILFSWILAYLSYILSHTTGESFWGWRLYAFGAAGLLLGVIIQRKRLTADTITTTLFTFFVVFIIYGGIMNAASLLMQSSMSIGIVLNAKELRGIYLTGLPYDLAHAGGAAFVVFLLGDSLLARLERIQTKYGILIDL
jgi:energy-coupling factor transport system substrate-specific component